MSDRSDFSDSDVLGLDEQLAALVRTAQESPARSRERQRVLTQLLAQLRRDKLARPRRDLFQGFYEEVYSEAVQRLFIYICEHIDAYNPDRGTVLQWVNFLLTRRFFIEASREFRPLLPKGMDPKSVQRLSLDDLEYNISSESIVDQEQFLFQQIAQYIQDDPRGLFCSTHVDRFPHVTFQSIALRRLEGVSWKAIAQEFQIPVPTLSSFYQRRLKDFTPYFKDDLL